MSSEQEQLVQEESPNNNASYVDKTNRLFALSQLIKSITPIIWTIIILVVVIGILGKISIRNIGAENSSKPEYYKQNHTIETVVPSPIPPEVDKELVLALENARTSAEEYASQELNEWIEQLMERVDNDFLNWYFNYFTQLKLGVKGIYIDLSSFISNRLNQKNSTSGKQKAEKLTEDFQTEFAFRVLKPEIAQLKLERFTRETIKTYVSELSVQLGGIKSKYNIPQADWEKYIGGISITIFDSTGNSQDLSLRLLSRGTGYIVALPLTKVTVKLASGLVTKFSEKIAVKGTTKIATKLSTKAASKVATKVSVPTLSTIGLELVDPLAALGILAWDIWDHYHTVNVEKPIIRQAIIEYLNEMKLGLIYNSQDSIMSAIYRFEEGLINQLEADKPQEESLTYLITN